jgi:hypothetical protein
MPTWQEKVADSIRRVRKPDTNPFSVLEVQMSLSRVDGEIEALLTDDKRFARGHHLKAARLAYDHLIEQACRLADITDLPQDRSVRRVVAEAELRSRGWTW